MLSLLHNMFNANIASIAICFNETPSSQIVFQLSRRLWVLFIDIFKFYDIKNYSPQWVIAIIEDIIYNTASNGYDIGIYYEMNECECVHMSYASVSQISFLNIWLLRHLASHRFRITTHMIVNKSSALWIWQKSAPQLHNYNS